MIMLLSTLCTDALQDPC